MQALERLAQRDCAQPLPLPALLAEVRGLPRAACSLQRARTIADPFFPTAHLLELLELHARALNAASKTPRRQCQRPVTSRPRQRAEAPPPVAASPAT